MRRAVLLTTTLLGLVAAVRAEVAALPPQPDGVAWPTTGWPTGPMPAGIDAEAFRAAIDDAFVKKLAGLGETRELLVIQGGRLVHEQYAPGYSADMPLVSWSMAKSITQALVGIAVQQGRLDIGRPMGSPHWAHDDPRARIAWRTWLQMTDGQRYLEIEAKTIADSDASRKLFGPGRLDVARYCAGLPLIHDPGSHWNYNSCGIVLTADALTRTIVPAPDSPQARRAAMLAWMRASLFEVIGMNAQPEFDASGLFYGSALIYATARDWAKFGLLYLRGGVWEGRQLLPPGWVDYARSPGTGANADIYGAGWWITPQAGSGRPYPTRIDTGPRRDGFSAQGFEGQYTLVVPSKDLIVVRMGWTPEKDLRGGALRDWMGRLARAFPEAAAMASPSAPAVSSH